MAEHGHDHGHGHGHDHGHGHGDHAAEERERILKIYGWAVVVWVCLLAGAFWIYKAGAARHGLRGGAQGHRKATLRRASHAAATGVAQARKRRPHTERAAIKLGPVQRRRAEARRWAQRMRRNGHAVRARALGQAHEIFDVSYPADVDLKRRDAQGRHLKQLQHSKSFQDHLRGLGFKRVALHVGRRVVWSTNL